MILRWLRTIFNANPIHRENGSIVEKQLLLVDVAHEVLVREALEQQAALKSFEKYGTPLMQKQERRQKIRTKIKSLLRLPLTASEENDLVDEVTERIAEVAEADPYFLRLFGKSGKNI